MNAAQNAIRRTASLAVLAAALAVIGLLLIDSGDEAIGIALLVLAVVAGTVGVVTMARRSGVDPGPVGQPASDDSNRVAEP